MLVCFLDKADVWVSPEFGGNSLDHSFRHLKDIYFPEQVTRLPQDCIQGLQKADDSRACRFFCGELRQRTSDSISSVLNYKNKAVSERWKYRFETAFL